jgi:kynurenine formamidase
VGRLVDLSQDIYEGMKVYPGHLKTVTFQHDNGPTHVDSFSHLDPTPGSATIDEMPLDLFYGPAICLDVSAVPERTDITSEHLDAALASTGLDLRRGDMCFFFTGTFDKYHGTNKYLTNFAGLGESGGQWIVDHGIKTFGVDSPTPDNPISTIYPIHLMSRHQRITHYENLVLTEVAGKRFTFVGFPLKVVGAHGGPTRAVAILDD